MRIPHAKPKRVQIALRLSSALAGATVSKPPPRKPAPLRTPSTRRSQLTVDAILQSFAELCAQYGYEEVTMNLMAERAGVSVGAIYQYFPNKEAIAVALYEETSSRAALGIRTAILQNLNESIAQTIPRALALLLKAYQDHRAVLIDLPDSSPRIREAIRHLSVEDLINRSSRIYIEQHVDEIGGRDLELLRYMLYAVVKGAIREFILHPPQGITEAGFLDELTGMIATYSLSAQTAVPDARLQTRAAKPLQASRSRKGP